MNVSNLKIFFVNIIAIKLEGMGKIQSFRRSIISYNVRLKLSILGYIMFTDFKEK